MTDLVHVRELFPLVLPHVPGCTDMLVAQALRMAATTFCERTRIWREAMSITVEPGEPANVAVDGATIHAIEHVMIEGRKLSPMAFTDATGQDLATPGRPWIFTQTIPGEITILPEPAEAVTLDISLFLKPRQDADFASGGGPLVNAYDVIPAFLKQTHGIALAAGACQRLMVMPGKPWTSPDLAVWWGGVFEQAIGDAAGISVRGEQRAPIRTKSVWF